MPYEGFGNRTGMRFNIPALSVGGDDLSGGVSYAYNSADELTGDSWFGATLAYPQYSHLADAGGNLTTLRNFEILPDLPTDEITSATYGNGQIQWSNSPALREQFMDTYI